MVEEPLSSMDWQERGYLTSDSIFGKVGRVGTQRTTAPEVKERRQPMVPIALATVAAVDARMAPCGPACVEIVCPHRRVMMVSVKGAIRS